jgi:hypothetical protein
MKANAVILAIAVTVAAIAGRPAAGEGDWQFTIAPYLVAAAMDGTVGVKGHDVTLDVPFSDIWANLHFGGMAHFDMKNDRWLLSSDLIYMDLRQDAEVANGTAEVKVTETLFEVAGGYRVSPAFTVLAGARLVDLGSELGFSGALASSSGKQSKSWVDPFLGAQLGVALSDRWWFDLHGDIGGFDVGSKLAWQAYADVGYRASDTVSLYVGYRALDIDYESGSGSTLFRYDVLTSGPQIGIAFHF